MRSHFAQALFLGHFQTLFLRRGLSEVGESLAALELGVLDHTLKLVLAWDANGSMGDYILASASLLKLPDHVTNVCPWCLPDVTGYARMVETTEEYESSGLEVITEYVM